MDKPYKFLDSDVTIPNDGKPEIRARLERLKKEVRRATKFSVPHVTKSKSTPTIDGSEKSRGARAAVFVGKILLVIGLPFFILVGGSVWLYARLGLPTWFALFMAVAATGAVLSWYVTKVTKTLNAEIKFRFVATRVALPLVVAYCGYSLVYLSRVNAKSEDVRQYYTAVHPLLRVAITTATVFDRELVVTDMARVPEDYDRMGLPRLENSLHFEQDDGYVHAVDLRTMRRAEWRNLLMRAYFASMGFRTLRHVGTADHLHVSLPLR